NQETSFSNFITQKPLDEIQAPKISFNPNFNPFDDEVGSSKSGTSARSSEYASSFERKTAIPQNWDTLYQITEQETATQLPLLPDTEAESDSIPRTEHRNPYFHIDIRYIASQLLSVFI